jgi:hypothetical protein
VAKSKSIWITFIKTALKRVRFVLNCLGKPPAPNWLHRILGRNWSKKSERLTTSLSRG